MSFDLYQEAILDELRHPQNKGVLPHADITIHETNASCGDDLTVELTFDPHTAAIAEVGWVGSGCAISQSAMSLLSEKIKGMTRDEVLALDQKSMEDLLGLPEPIAYGRIKCLLLGLNSVQKALKEATVKNYFWK
jgi:nitrogen fixation NifU-like protein